MKPALRLFLMTVAAAVGAASASAQEIDGSSVVSNNYASGSGGDLLLVFYAPGASDLVFDIGPVSSYWARSEAMYTVREFSGGGTSGVTPGSGRSDLIANFGSDLSNVSWTIVGANNQSHTLWVTSHMSSDVQYTDTPSNEARVGSYLIFVGSEAKNNPNVHGANPGDALLTDHPVYNGLNPSQTWIAGQQSVSQTAAGVTELTLWQLSPSVDGPQPGLNLGFFVMNPNTGTLTFNPNVAIPETRWCAALLGICAFIAVTIRRWPAAAAAFRIG